MFLSVLCIFLMVSLGINYSKVVSSTITTMKEYNPSPITKPKYKTPDDYYSDAFASQGVFSKTVPLSLDIDTHILEPMTTKPTSIPKANETVGYKGAHGSAYTTTGTRGSAIAAKGTHISAIAAKGPNKSGYVVKGPQGNVYAGTQTTQSISGCAGTQYGCCPDNVTSKNADGSNCPAPIDGGCAGTQYGCCPDNVTSKNADGSNCPAPIDGGCAGTQFVGGCAGTQYGCCPDNVTSKNADGSNCPAPIDGGCAGTQYGCCPDNVTSKNADGSNCMSAWSYKGPNVTGFAASGPNNSGYVIKGPNGNIYAGTTSNCALSQYGCCPDNVTSKNADGSNCVTGSVNTYSASGPNNSFYAVQGPNGNVFTASTANCSTSPYGCCPDNVTAKNMDGTNCLIGGCSGTQYGCCPDNLTAKNMDGTNCSPYPPPPPQSQTTNTVFIPPPKGSNYTANTTDSSASSASATGTDTTDPSTDSGTSVSCPTPQPCPPCGRCPEPSFDCKKVPNYSSTNSEYLPMPVLNDFSQFGM